MPCDEVSEPGPAAGIESLEGTEAIGAERYANRRPSALYDFLDCPLLARLAASIAGRPSARGRPSPFVAAVSLTTRANKNSTVNLTESGGTCTNLNNKAP